ncbi:MAG: Sir2 family NAD-dependent protein deacetylase [Mariniblastus sp.]|nr:Sir2 family NAD-dependent protein deacetylase [Mariniblastus sp.]
MQPYQSDRECYQEAARIIHNCDAVLITAGAGLGVDSGLPDFRGTEGFWQAYPAFRQKGLDFFDLANPRWFKDDPQQAWGFYGHRQNLYRATTPHAGFKILLDWVRKVDHNYFVFTSNVDGHFQKTGFSPERIHECHGSFEFLQCSDACTTQTWSAEKTHLQIDEETLIANQPIPKCPVCDAPARPNILMFGDSGFIPDYHQTQNQKYKTWLSDLSAETKIAIIEIGAGTVIPTVRSESEKVAREFNQPMIRINPRDNKGPEFCISIGDGGLESLCQIENELRLIKE